MLKVTMLQTPKVELDGKTVVFPFKRVDALLYYMVVHRSATRQELISLLWESCDESLGLKNLRNTLYTLKKCLGGDFLLSPQKSVVVVNGEWELDCDYDRFQEGDFSARKGAFLQGFSVKNAFSYEEWLGRTRDRVQAQYLRNLAKQARAAQADGTSEQAIQLAAAYLQEEPLDEEMLLFLMNLYRQGKQYPKAAQAYQRLKERLADEMGTDPLEKTTLLYYEILGEWKEVARPAEEPAAVPVGREDAYASLRAAALSFLDRPTRRCSQLVVGDVGAGKSELIDAFVENQDLSSFLVLRGACLPTEEHTPLALWNALLPAMQEGIREEGISLPAHVVAELEHAHPPDSRSILALTDTFRLLLGSVARQRKLLLIVEDFQWIDRESLLLTDHLLRRLDAGGCMAILTCRDDCGTEVGEFRERSVADGLLRLHRLYPLTGEQTRELLHRQLGEEAAMQLSAQFHAETGGNPHLLHELIRAYRNSGGMEAVARTMADILAERLAGLGDSAMKVAELLSLFPQEAPYSILQSLMEGDNLLLSTGIQALQERSLVEETRGEGEPGFRFTYRRMRELLYDRLPVFQRRRLHLQVARLLAGAAIPQDSEACRRIARQFALAGEDERAAEYRVRALELESVCSCEPFGRYASAEAPHKSPADLEQEANSETQVLARLRGQRPESTVLPHLERMLLLIRGRIALFQGHSSEGIALLGGLSEIPGRDATLMVKACYLLALSAVYSQDADRAERYTVTGMRLLDRSGDRVLAALLQRLRGDCFCLRGEYDKSVYYLLEAADALERLPASAGCRLPLAGVYYDYGRVCRQMRDFAQASSYYRKALALIGEGEPLVGTVWIHANYGRMAFALEDHAGAREQFLRGYRAGLATGELWGLSVAAAFTAHYQMLDGSYEESARTLAFAQDTLKRLESPLEEAILCFVSMLMRDRLDAEGRRNLALSRLLPYSVESYARQGIRKLSGVPDVFEAEQLSRRLREGITTRQHYRTSELYSKNKHFMTE